MTKTCSKCGIDKPLDAFYKRNDRPSGVSSSCKACTLGNKCADCGKAIARHATYCLNCRFKGDRNPIAGTTRPEHVKEAVSNAHLGVPEKPRQRKKPKDAHAGRKQANSLYAKPEHCERCGEKKRLDWHHVNEDATDNRRENLMALCRRCHQIVDGRHDFLTGVMPKMGRRAQIHAGKSSSNRLP